MLISAALLTSVALPSQAAFIERYIEAPNITPVILIDAPYSIISDEMIDHPLRGPSNVKDITITVNDAGQLVINNNTVRKFGSFNVIIDGTGVNIATNINPRTQVTIDLTEINLSSTSKISRLEPYGAFSPSANGFHKNLEKDIWMEVYADIQRNMMTFYARAETYDKFQRYFWIGRDESKSDTLRKWHRTVTYPTPKNYRLSLKSTGVSGGSWFGLAAYTLDRSFTVTDSIYSSHYGTFSHENAHSMGFKHGTGLAYGWDNPVRAEMKKLIENGSVNRVASGDEPTVHDNDFFLHFEEENGLQLYQKNGAEFTGIDWIKIVYDDSNLALSESYIEDNKIKFDVNKIKPDRLLFSARIADQEYMANLTYRVTDYRDTISLGGSRFLIPEMGEDVLSGLVIDPTTGATGPTEPTSVRGGDPTAFTFPITSESGETITIQATGRTYYPGCAWKQMENSAGCRKKTSSDANLYITISKEDNPHLVNGKYTGSLPLHQVSYSEQDNIITHQFPVDISIFDDPTPDDFANEQIKMENDRLELITQMPIIPGTQLGHSNPVDAFTFELNGEIKTLCYMQDAEKDLITIPLFGFVENNFCSIGENNSYEGQVGYSSENFLTYDKHTMKFKDGKAAVTLPETGETVQLCYRTDEEFIGVGYSSTGTDCKSNMKASNGNDWNFSKGSQFIDNKRDTLDQLPVNEGWVLPNENITPLIVNFDFGEKAICRMSIVGIQLLGYVDEGKCSIGENNIWKGVQGFGSENYQIVDANAKQTIEAVQVTVSKSNWFSEAIDVDLCYRPEADVAGVGFSTYGEQCMQHDRGVTKSTGENWYFGYGSNSPKVMWDYGLSLDDIWVAPSKAIFPFQLSTITGDKVVCRFKANKKSHYGLVNELNQCEVGDNIRLNDEYNYSDAKYQVISTAATNTGENITFNDDSGAQVQLCRRDDTVGYSFNGERCQQAEMLAGNGKRWYYSHGNQMIQYSYTFPKDEAWVFPEQAVTPLQVSTERGVLTVCRTNYNHDGILGFVIGEQCKINDNINIEGNAGFSSEYYQIIDSTLGLSGEFATVTWNDGIKSEMCFRSDLKYTGVGIRNSSEFGCKSNLQADNGNQYYFSSGAKHLLFP